MTKNLLTLLFSMLIVSACSSAPTNSIVKNEYNHPNKLYIYQDGRMQYKSRYVSNKDVVIYDDGTGGERAAIKVRVPIRSDFYRDSIIVVRVEKVTGESVTQNNSDKVDTMN